MMVTDYNELLLARCATGVQKTRCAEETFLRTSQCRITVRQMTSKLWSFVNVCEYALAPSRNSIARADEIDGYRRPKSRLCPCLCP